MSGYTETSPIPESVRPVARHIAGMMYPGSAAAMGGSDHEEMLHRAAVAIAAAASPQALVKTVAELAKQKAYSSDPAIHIDELARVYDSEPYRRERLAYLAETQIPNAPHSAEAELAAELEESKAGLENYRKRGILWLDAEMDTDSFLPEFGMPAVNQQVHAHTRARKVPDQQAHFGYVFAAFDAMGLERPSVEALCGQDKKLAAIYDEAASFYDAHCRQRVAALVKEQEAQSQVADWRAIPLTDLAKSTIVFDATYRQAKTLGELAGAMKANISRFQPPSDVIREGLIGDGPASPMTAERFAAGQKALLQNVSHALGVQPPDLETISTPEAERAHERLKLRHDYLGDQHGRPNNFRAGGPVLQDAQRAAELGEADVCRRIAEACAPRLASAQEEVVRLQQVMDATGIQSGTGPARYNVTRESIERRRGRNS